MQRITMVLGYCLRNYFYYSFEVLDGPQSKLNQIGNRFDCENVPMGFYAVKLNYQHHYYHE